MADMVVTVDQVQPSTTGYQIQGTAFTSDMPVDHGGVVFFTTVGWNKTMAKANAQIQDDAIAALAAATPAFAVGANDNKILLGGVGGF